MGCGFAWTHPPLPAELIASYYPASYLGDTQKVLEDYQTGALQRSRSWRDELRKTRLVERVVGGGSILDIGCGEGRFLWALDPAKWERFGVERAQETIDLVRSRIASLHLIIGDIFAPELKEGSFHAVTFWHVLEHLPDPEKTLRRAAALLKPGGWLFVSLPDIESLQAQLFRRHWYAFDDVPRHLYHFSRRSLDRVLRQTGFQIAKHLAFSAKVNFHSLKHSMIHWSEERCGNRRLYYALKPLLFVLQMAERISGKTGIFTVVARKPL
jgi:SAM-dependent methyltransferase